MTRKEWENICIGFDENNFLPCIPMPLNDCQIILDEYKKAFKDVLKDLEILGILKNIVKVDDNTKFTYGNKKYIISLRQDVIVNDETLKIIKEWLENEKNN